MRFSYGGWVTRDEFACQFEQGRTERGKAWKWSKKQAEDFFDYLYWSLPHRFVYTSHVRNQRSNGLNAICIWSLLQQREWHPAVLMFWWFLEPLNESWKTIDDAVAPAAASYRHSSPAEQPSARALSVFLSALQDSEQPSALALQEDPGLQGP
jgi:hypothetical protein